MCGIAGIVTKQDESVSSLPLLEAALTALRRRGPDASGTFSDRHLHLGHTRLSIIDTSSGGAQPMTDASGRYTIVFNGEFFNFKEQREELKRKGISFRSESDTEVLLHWYILEGPECLQRVNGFFALAIYDHLSRSLFIARDRMGIKPLWIFQDSERFLFASELKALLKMEIPKEIDPVSISTYLQLNYIPGPTSIFKNVSKLEPGHYLYWKDIGASVSPEKVRYYTHPASTPQFSGDYATACRELYRRMEDAVRRRMIADVPLGAFLSGGIDSSVIVGLAARETERLKTFSIGFKDEPLFDETRYAETVAKRHRTDHQVFRLTNDDLFSILFDALDYLDEPFADSSALNVFLLSRETRKHVTVALSGDGADELFSGYHKHAAEWRVRHKGWRESLITSSGRLWRSLPQSRNSKTGNLVRQLDRFAAGAALEPSERYWRWASIASESEARELFPPPAGSDSSIDKEFLRRKEHWTRRITASGDLNDVLWNDAELVLQNDMLVKADLMSMGNSLEIRSPFLDYTVVDYAFSLPASFKIDRHQRKKIVRDTFHDLLPEEILHRRKQGFEVPLLNWFKNGLRSLITEDLLSDSFIRQQGLFDPDAIRLLLKKLFSKSPGDSVARVWALIVFQYWWKKHMDDGR